LPVTWCPTPGWPAPSGAGGRGGASPLQGGRTHPRSGIRVRGLGAAPVRRGQAVPDPSGPPGPAGLHRRSTAVGVACRTAVPPGSVGPAFRHHRCVVIGHGALPRLVARAGEAPPRPYKVGRFIPGRVLGGDDWVQPPSGRGQVVPDPPARRAGISPRTPVAGRSGSSPHAGMGRACAAPSGAGGRGRASPLQGGRTHLRSGIGV